MLCYKNACNLVEDEKVNFTLHYTCMLYYCNYLIIIRLIIVIEI